MKELVREVVIRDEELDRILKKFTSEELLIIQRYNNILAKIYEEKLK